MGAKSTGRVIKKKSRQGIQTTRTILRDEHTQSTKVAQLPPHLRPAADMHLPGGRSERRTSSAAMSGQVNWGYSNVNGPHTWCLRYPAAAGSRQSPVNLDSTVAKFESKLLKRQLRCHYPQIGGCSLENTGFSFKVSAGGQEATISGGPLCNKYKFEQLHMHWGKSDSVGSEHALDGRLYPCELHLVHWDCDTHSTFELAASADDGLAVLGVFFELGEANPELEKLLNNFDLIEQPHSSTRIDCELDFLALLPDRDLRDYFTYPGSLTTPPCSETVTWIVMKRPATLSKEQLLRLRKLKSGDPAGEENIVDNYRSLIPLGNRRLLTSWQS